MPRLRTIFCGMPDTYAQAPEQLNLLTVPKTNFQQQYFHNSALISLFDLIPYIH